MAGAAARTWGGAGEQALPSWEAGGLPTGALCLCISDSKTWAVFRQHCSTELAFQALHCSFMHTDMLNNRDVSFL